MKKNNLFLDLHAIQTLPPANINRDDTGSPKTAQYGGVRRARVSSQSWKKAMRDYFKSNGDLKNVGIRSLDIVSYLANKILEIDSSKTYEACLKLANQTINNAGIKTKDNRAKALFFLGDIQAKELAKAAIDGEEKSKLKEILQANPAIDMALFGRMVADDPSLNEDASSQVAHAISTHAVQTEFDFFTAVDDLSPEDNAGAGMLGTVEFNSSTLYRYANVAIHELEKQLNNKEAVVNTLKLYIEAFVKSLPSGKSNTFANQTLPQAIILTLRDDRPVNLVSAFETPIKSNEGYVKKSIDNLLKEYKKVEKIVDKSVYSSCLILDDYQVDNEDIKIETSLKSMLDNFSNEVKIRLENNLGE